MIFSTYDFSIDDNDAIYDINDNFYDVINATAAFTVNINDITVSHMLFLILNETSF